MNFDLSYRNHEAIRKSTICTTVIGIGIRMQQFLISRKTLSRYYHTGNRTGCILLNPVIIIHHSSSFKRAFAFVVASAVHFRPFTTNNIKVQGACWMHYDDEVICTRMYAWFRRTHKGFYPRLPPPLNFQHSSPKP